MTIPRRSRVTRVVDVWMFGRRDSCDPGSEELSRCAAIFESNSPCLEDPDYLVLPDRKSVV